MLCCRTETKIYKHSYHETTILKKNESGAEGRKRRKQEAKEAEKLKKFFVPFFKRCSSVNTDDNPISKVQSYQSDREPEKVDQSKQESEEIGQSEKLKKF